MAVKDYVIEYKARIFGNATADKSEYQDAQIRAKLEGYKSAGKLFLYIAAEGDDQVRVWADQATLDEYNTWFASNSSEWQAYNVANNITITKTFFKAS